MSAFPKADVQNVRIGVKLMCPLSRKQTFRTYVFGSSRMSACGRKQTFVNIV